MIFRAAFAGILCLLFSLTFGEIPRYESRALAKKTHPAYDIISLRPDSVKIGVGGMDFLSDGRLVVTHREGYHSEIYKKGKGAVFVVDGVLGDNVNKDNIKFQRITPTDLDEPLGLKVIDDVIYVLLSDVLIKMEAPPEGEMATIDTVHSGWDPGTWAFGLLHKEGYFYIVLGNWRAPDSRERGTVLKIPVEGGSHEIWAGGIRSGDGLGWGPNGELFVTDNQGEYLPACKMMHVEQGKFYGFRFNENIAFIEQPDVPPTLWLPYSEAGKSTTQPITIQSGPYAGQILVGDVNWGGIRRVFLEKVEGALQGCIMDFTGNLDAGVHRLVYGPDGDLYVGGLGSKGVNHDWEDQWYGLDKIKPNGGNAFEIYSMRSRLKGFQIDFNMNANEKIKDPENFRITQWNYIPTEKYGGKKQNKENLNVTSVQYSEDQRSVFLEIEGLKKGYVIQVAFDDQIKSQSGEDLYTNYIWYTLNEFGPDIRTVSTHPQNKTFHTSPSFQAPARLRDAGSPALIRFLKKHPYSALGKILDY